MKFISKITLSLLVVGALIYAGCKKIQSNPATTSKSGATAAQNGQIAVNLYKALTGKFGGANINNGLKPPSNLAMGHNSKVLQSVSALCGFMLDTAFKNVSMSGDTTVTDTGNFKFVFNCTAGVVNGYSLDDSLSNSQSAPGFLGGVFLGQHYTAKGLNPALTQFLINGQINSAITSAYQGPPIVTHSLTAQYTLAGLTVDSSTSPADITTGVATFTITTIDVGPQYGPKGTTTSYAGTITFLGNHMAKLVITGVGSYSVNLITGVTTQI